MGNLNSLFYVNIWLTINQNFIQGESFVSCACYRKERLWIDRT